MEFKKRSEKFKFFEIKKNDFKILLKYYELTEN